jgi:hypothetical protein
MGNAILRCFKGECDDILPPAEPYRPGIPSSPQFGPSPTAGFLNLTIHLKNFELNSLVSFFFVPFSLSFTMHY